MSILRTPRARTLAVAFFFLASLMVPVAVLAAPGSAALRAQEPAAAAAQDSAEQMPQDPEEQTPQDPAIVQEGGELTGVDAHAEEGEHEADAKPWFYWPAKWFNFIALCGLMYWVLVVTPPVIGDLFSFPGLRVVLTDRAAGIIAARDLAVRQSEEAGRLLSESEERLSRIEEEVAALVSDAHRDAASEKERALEDGKLQAEKIIEVAGREVDNERVGANRHLRVFVADLAVSMAARNLTEHLTPDDRDRLIRDYLSRLGKSMA